MAHTFNLLLVLKVSSNVRNHYTLSLATEKWEWGREELGGLHCSVTLNKVQPRTSPDNISDGSMTLFPLPVRPSFHFHCHSQMLFMDRNNEETEPTRSRHKELIRAIRGNSLPKEFNQRLKIIKRTQVYITFRSLWCSAMHPGYTVNWVPGSGGAASDIGFVQVA